MRARAEADRQLRALHINSSHVVNSVDESRNFPTVGDVDDTNKDVSSSSSSDSDDTDDSDRSSDSDDTDDSDRSSDSDDTGDSDDSDDTGDSDRSTDSDDMNGGSSSPGTSDGNSSSSDENAFNHEPPSLRSDLASWQATSNVSMNAVTALLHILRRHGIQDLPLDARTLMQTPVNVQLRSIRGGLYYHFGIAVTMRQALKGLHVLDGDVIKLIVNIDGLPVGKSTPAQVWPILVSAVLRNNRTPPFAVGMFCGDCSKPPDVDEYLREFVDEYNDIRNNDLRLGFRTVRVRIHAVVCDAPARAYVKCVKLHSGYAACDKCEVFGRRYRRRQIFPNLTARRRRDIDFLRQTDKEHHKPNAVSPFVFTGIGMVSQFPSEYQHNMLGVLKRLLHLWTNGPRGVRLSAGNVKIFSEILKACADSCPTEFARKPRELRYLDRFKSTELRTFLCYTGVFAGRNVLPPRYYRHFCIFVCAARILLNPVLAKNDMYVDAAEKFLTEFAKWFGKIYGRRHMVYNVHVLIHVADDVRRYGCLDDISSFPFESHMYSIKRLLRKPGCTLMQLVRRLTERSSVGIHAGAPVLNWHDDALLRRWLRGPMPAAFQHGVDVPQYQTVWYRNVRFSVVGRDSAIITEHGHIGVICNIITRRNSVWEAVVRLFQVKQPLFHYPMSSSKVGIHRVQHLGDALHVFGLNRCRKVWLMCDDDFQVAVELNNAMV